MSSPPKQLKQEKSAKWGLMLIILGYLALAVSHSLIVPLTAGNDEWAHFLYVRFIAEHGYLPTTWTERDEAGYKSDAPPLYHLLVSGATAGVEPTQRLRRLDSPRRELAGNEANPYAIVHTAVEFLPFRGEVLIWYLGRGLSILFGLALILVTYLTALELSRRAGARRSGGAKEKTPLLSCSSAPLLALTATALVAFWPAFIFHSSVLSYESLSATLTALFLLVSIKAIKQPDRWRWWLLLGALTGLSVTTKYSAILLPLEVILVVWLANRQRGRFPEMDVIREPPQSQSRWRFIFQRLVVAGVAAVLGASWWFGFVAWHFNTIETQGPLVGALQPLLVGDASDTTSVRVAAFLFGESAAELDQRPRLARDYPQLFQVFSESFWAAPVNGRFVLSPWLPLIFTLVAVLGVVGLWPVWRRAGPTTRTWLILLIAHTLLITPLLAMRILLSFDPREAAQGRHFLLPAAPAIAILLVWGWRTWHPHLGQAVVLGLFLWSLLGQVAWAAVSYAPPLTVWPGNVAAPLLESEAPRPLLDSLDLVDVLWEAETDVLAVTLWWRALKPMPEDYLVELTVFDEARRVVGYALGHPLQGRYPTRAWEPDDVVKETHWLPLKAHQPGDYELQLRLLDRTAQPLAGEPTIPLGKVTLTGSATTPEPCAVWFQGRSKALLPRTYPLRSSLTVMTPELPRLRATEPDEQVPFISIEDIHIFVVEPHWTETYQLFVGETNCGSLSFDIPSRAFTIPDLPTPLEANFNDEIRLLGYELPTRRIQPGQRLPLTLYWQGLAYMGEDYRMFDNLLDLEQQRWGGYDRRAKDGYSTLLWVPGEVITDAFGVPVDPDAPPGIYTLDIGWYKETAQGIESHPLMTEGEPTGPTSIRLGPIKVGGPPPDVLADEPNPQFILNQPFGEEITLLGYDLTDDKGQSIQNPARGTQAKSKIQNLQLTLYWQAEAVPNADYTTFLHLRDEANQNAAQKDTPPANGRYPTSLWDPGEIIVDEINLSLEQVPSGRYEPTLGLYNFTTGERLPVPGHPANEISLQPVEIE